MKVIPVILFALMGLFSNVLKAQDIQMPDFSNFIGTWEYKTDSEWFILKTKSHMYITSDGKAHPEVVGVYKYVKDGVVIYDYLDRINECGRNCSFNYITFVLQGEPRYDIQYSLLGILFKDPKTINRSDVAKMRSSVCVLPSDYNKLHFYMFPMPSGEPVWESENGNESGILDDEFLVGFSIPSSMVLTRIE